MLIPTVLPVTDFTLKKDYVSHCLYMLIDYFGSRQSPFPGRFGKPNYGWKSGTETVSLKIRANPWYGTIFLLLDKIALSWRHINYLCWSTHMSWALSWTLSRRVKKWWELRDALADFPQGWQGTRHRIRTRTLLSTFMLWVYGKSVFLRVENFFKVIPLK